VEINITGKRPLGKPMERNVNAVSGEILKTRNWERKS
jgi:hypothetical protein